MDDIPGGVIPQGDSPEDAMAGLFDALADEFEDESENEDSAQSTPGDGDVEMDGESDDEEYEDDLEDEDDLDDSEDDDESEEGENEEEDGEDLLYEVTLPGGEKTQVTLEELQAGYSRTEDYTRKRQRDAAEHAETMTEVREIRDQYADRLEKLKQTLSDLGPKEPTSELRQRNPGEYAAQLAEYQAFQETLNKVEQAEEVISSEKQQELAAAQRDYVNAEWAKVVAAVPEWAEQDAAIAGLAELKEHSMGLGFTAEELSGLADSRLLLVLKQNHDLTKKRTTGKQKVQAKRKSSKRLKPGGAKKTPAGRRKQGRKAQQAADQLAAESGSVKHAARAIEMLLGDDD